MGLNRWSRHGLLLRRIYELESFGCLDYKRRDGNLPGFIKNVSVRLPELNGSLTGLERLIPSTTLSLFFSSRSICNFNLSLESRQGENITTDTSRKWHNSHVTYDREQERGG